MAVVAEANPKHLHVNLDRCIECGSCAAVCFASHGNSGGVEHAREGVALLPAVCRQCDEPACVCACPNGAMTRDEHGLVRRRLAHCTGCGTCSRACPFGVLSDNGAGIPTSYRSRAYINGHAVGKCDLCASLNGGEAEAHPRCVAACPAGALLFADLGQVTASGLTILGGRAAGEDPFKRR